MKRILTISGNDQGISWGPAVHFLELWNSFASLDNNPYSVSGIVPSWTKKNFIKKTLFDVTVVSVPNVRRVRQMVFDFAVARKILSGQHDFIYVRLASFHLFSLFLMKRLKIKPIIELNGLTRDDAISAKLPSWYRNLLVMQEKLLISMSSATVAVSEGIGVNARKIGCKKVFVIRNGVSDDYYQLSQNVRDDNHIKVIYVGTFTSWDGSHLIPTLAKEFPKIEFLIVGDGLARQKIQQQSPSNVSFFGYIPYTELRDYYKKSDAGLAIYEIERHKKVELSSLKTLEYMACGLPIFTTRVPGQEFIEENAIGMLSNPKTLYTDFSDFVANLDMFKRNVNSYRNENGFKYSWKRAAVETREVFNDLSRGKMRESLLI